MSTATQLSPLFELDSWQDLRQWRLSIDQHLGFHGLLHFVNDGPFYELEATREGAHSQDKWRQLAIALLRSSVSEKIHDAVMSMPWTNQEFGWDPSELSMTTVLPKTYYDRIIETAQKQAERNIPAKIAQLMDLRPDPWCIDSATEYFKGFFRLQEQLEEFGVFLPGAVAFNMVIKAVKADHPSYSEALQERFHKGELDWARFKEEVLNFEEERATMTPPEAVDCWSPAAPITSPQASSYGNW